MNERTDDRTWLIHPATGGYFHCPAEALRDWTGLGWVPADAPPPEFNPVVAERIAWEAEQAELRAAAIAASTAGETEAAQDDPASQEAPGESTEPESARRGLTEE